MRTAWRVLCVAVVVPLFIACAGGSGGDVSGPDQQGGSHTHPPLTVSSTEPPAGETGIDLNATVVAHLDNNIDPSTPASAFTLTQGGTPVAGTVEFSESNATFTPSDFLGANLSYTATLSTALKDQDGSALAKPYSWSFTTSDCARFFHVDSFPLGPQAADVFSEVMTTDGTNIYLLIEPASSNDDILLTIDPQAKAVTGSITIPVVPPQNAYSPPVDSGIGFISDIAWHHGALWFAGEYWMSGTEYLGVFEVNPATGMPGQAIPLPSSNDPNEWDGLQGFASDGTDFYASVKRQFSTPYTDTTLIVKFDPASTTQISLSSPFSSSPIQVHQMDFGGGFLWVLTEEGPPRRIHKVDPNTAQTLTQICVDQDGANILYVDGDFWSASGSEMKILSLK